MSQSTLQILVVDDEPDLEPLIRQGFRPEVQSGKYVFSFASDGVQALNVIKQDLSIDLVLTDLSMPNMDSQRRSGNGSLRVRPRCNVFLHLRHQH